MALTDPRASRLRQARHGRSASVRATGGSSVIGHLLDLIDGPSLRSVLRRRAVANGLDREELDLALRHVPRLIQLPRFLDSIAQDLENRGRYWNELGLRPRARDYYLRAAIWSFYSQLLLTDQPEIRDTAYRRCRESYRQAAPLFDHPAEAIDIPYPAGPICGYLRIPNIKDASAAYSPPDGAACLLEIRAAESATSQPARHPCVIILNSFASSKEELHYTENAFLNQRLATLSFDYPRQGDNLGASLDTFQQEILSNSLFLLLAAHPAIDADRIALFGIGTGGLLALNLAILGPERYRGVAALCAPYELPQRPARRLIPSRLRLSAIELGFEEAHSELVSSLSLRQRLGGIKSPLLVVGGGRDPYVSPEQTRRIYEESASQDKKLLLCPKAGHGCYEMMPSLRYEIARWTRERI